MKNINGGCHCGALVIKALVIKARVDENKVMICHCADCQKLSDTALRSTV